MGRKFLRAGHKCRHCGRERLRWWRRGLCWRCYARPEVLAQYPVPGSDADDLLTGRDFLGAAEPPPGPPPGLPRSEERLIALAVRADGGMELWPGPGTGGGPVIGAGAYQLFGVTPPAAGPGGGPAGNGKGPHCGGHAGGANGNGKPKRRRA